MKAPFIFVLLCYLTTPILAQKDWREMMHDPNANFFEIQRLFYQEFGRGKGKKGTGWKQFKRWEYYYQLRVDENGRFPAPGAVLKEMNRYRREHPRGRYALGTGSWQELGPIDKPSNGTGQPNGNGRLACIAFHPSDANTIYVGAPSGGFWKSTDGGASWAKSITGLTRLGISSIVLDPTNPDIIYIGTGDRDAGDAPGYGVWKSTDGGATWSSSNNGMGNRTVYEILMDPNDETRLVASTSGSRIYTSTDAGANWTAATISANAKDIAFKPGDASVIYAAGTRFDVSTNGGASFLQITNGVPSSVQRMAIAVSPNAPNDVFLLAGNGSGLVGLYRSTNSGSSFSAQSTSPNILGYSATGSDTRSQAWYDLVLASDPTDANILYAGGINIWKSTDGGVSWSIVAHWVGSGGVADVHADQHVLEFSPYTNELYAGHDGGIHITSDGGTTWTELSSGLGIAQVYKIGVSQDPDVAEVINGYQDNGTAIYKDGSWTTEIGGDGMECIIDPTDPNYMYGALYYGDIRRSTNGGTSFSIIAVNGTNGITESGGWVTPYKLDPNNPARMFIGYKNIWRSNDVKSPTSASIVWTQISSFTGSSNIQDIAVAPSNSNVMYVSRNGTNKFFRSSNALGGSPTWTDLTSNLPASSTPKDIEIDPLDADHLFIALGNNIYESSNGGASWVDISGSLPNISLNTIVIDPSSTVGAMYVGMDAGVYYKDNNMGDWSAYSTNLPNVEVTELEINDQSSSCRSLLYAATYGQGMWVSDLKDPGSFAPVACFKSSSTEVCVGNTVTLSDESSFSPTSWAWAITPTTFTFANGADANSQNPEIIFTAADTYTVELSVSNATGSNSVSKSNYIVANAAAVATNYNDDLESYAACSTTSNCSSTVCSLTGGLWSNLTNGTDDDIDFRIDSGGTPSSNTGPTLDANPGTFEGNYLYTESSSCSGTTAILESGCINLDQSYTFDMQYYMQGAAMGELHIDANIQGEWVEDIVGAISGDQGTSWQTLSIDLNSYAGQTIQLRMRGITGSSFTSDLAIDDIAFAPNDPLPVELVSFDAQLNTQQEVELSWQTASEYNTSHFEVEKSSNGMVWSPIHTEQAQNQSDIMATYRAKDQEPLAGLTYYRLKAVDTDHSFSYSAVKTVILAEGEGVKIYPNPTKDYLTISKKGIQENQVSIINALGQKILVKMYSPQSNELQAALGHLPKGVYFVCIETGEGAPLLLKFMVI